MSLFFNYNKPGRGISKDEPEKTGIQGYFTLLWRYLGRLTTANLLYFFIGLPVLALYFLLSNYIVINFFGDIKEPLAIIQTTIFIALLFFVVFGAGPITCGYTYILRNCARSEHCFVAPDFFEKTKQNFKYSIVLFIIDALFLFMTTVAICFYRNLMISGNRLFLIPEVLIIIVFIVYAFIHLYIYEFMITFEGGLPQMFKNSLMMSFGLLPSNLLYLAAMTVVLYFVCNIFTYIAILLVFAIIGVSLFRFPIDFFTARKIKRLFIDKKDSEADKNV